MGFRLGKNAISYEFVERFMVNSLIESKAAPYKERFLILIL